jgi:hypothetical protein
MLIEISGELTHKEVVVCKKESGGLEIFSLLKALKESLKTTRIDVIGSRNIDSEVAATYADSDFVII